MTKIEIQNESLAEQRPISVKLITCNTKISISVCIESSNNCNPTFHRGTFFL